MKAIVINKKPFGITEFDNVIQITSGNAATPVSDTFTIQYVVNSSAVQRTFNTSEVILQIM